LEYGVSARAHESTPAPIRHRIGAAQSEPSPSVRRVVEFVSQPYAQENEKNSLFYFLKSCYSIYG
jgi:hypothetical protein